MVWSAIAPIWSLTSAARREIERLVDTPALAEVIVVDATMDGQLLTWLHTFGKRTRRVPADPRATMPTARNAGAAVAAAAGLLFCDTEDAPDDGAFDALFACADRHPRYGIIGGKVLGVDEMVLRAGAVFGHDRLPRPLYHGLPGSHPAVGRSRVVQAVGGGPLLVSRAAFERAGGFDTAFALAYFDEDLSLRLGALGYDVVYCHDCVSHRETATAAAPASDTASFGVRWGAVARQDDVERYMQDGLLRLTYEPSGARRLSVSPLLAVVDESAVAVEAGHLLAARAKRVEELCRENVALAARVVAPAVTTKTFSQTMAELIPPPADYQEDPGSELTPPYDLALSVGGQFHEGGEEYFRYARELAGLQPSHRVLDVGCGVGRMAVKFAPFLATGSYAGFDIRADVIEWCQQHITPRHPHARFAFVDLANGLYNASGGTTSAQFRFPYPAESFDFVLLASVFTHMLPADLEHYMGEIAAVLAPGGMCLCSYFLLNEESLGLMRAGMSGPYNFSHAGDGYRAMAPAAPEFALAYEESWIRQVYGAHGLRVVEPVRYGQWCGRLNGLSLQDIVIARKELLVA